MANTNFLQFDTQQTNMLSDSDYENDTQRVSGVSEGIARSNLHNKTLFQTSTMAKAIADVIVENGQNAIDNNLIALKQAINGSFITKNTVGSTVSEKINLIRTNCITEIPQDIKYTISGGTVTILAGSKVWYPNGSETFSSYTLESNINHGWTGNKRLVFIDIDNKSSLSTEISQCSSGSSQPSSTSGRRIWYDTTNNQIKAAESGSSSFTKKLSFPILIQYGNGTDAYVDQVFNGFGYIGSTVFALPGVKVLAPNGRNTDGTLKNIVWTANSVITRTETGSSDKAYLAINTTNNTFGISRYQYDEFDNYNKVNGVISEGRCVVAQLTNTSGGVITDFTPKTVFHAVDYSDAAMKTGVVLLYGGNSAPDGFLVCDGSAISRTTYSSLFAVIGTSYGSGDGSTTFNLPNIGTIIKSVDTNVPVKGTGKTLGLTNGNVTYGLANSTPGGTNFLNVSASVPTGTAVSTNNVNWNNTPGIFGLSTDSTKSGIEGTVTRSSVGFKFIIKY